MGFDVTSSVGARASVEVINESGRQGVEGRRYRMLLPWRDGHLRSREIVIAIAEHGTWTSEPQLDGDEGAAMGQLVRILGGGNELSEEQHRALCALIWGPGEKAV